LLSEINRKLIEYCCARLNITTAIVDSSELITLDSDSATSQADKSQRLIKICKQLEADQYLSGPAARDYLDVEGFGREGIQCQWMDYAGYKPYPQRSKDFEHHVSILDLLFNTGANCREFMKCDPLN